MVSRICKIIASSVLALGISTTVTGQQSIDVDIRSYGDPCLAFGTKSVLQAEWDHVASTLTVSLNASPTCCNTILAGQFLMLGDVQMPGVPLPIPGVIEGCLLHVMPAVVVMMPSEQQSLVLPVPKDLPGGQQFFLQGLNDYFTTVNGTHELQLSDGLVARVII